MGIKGLRKFIDKYAKSAITEFKTDELKGKTIALDASILLYEFVIAIRNSKYDDLKNNAGISTSHIHAIIMKTLFFLKKKINPIYVFDAKPPSIKLNTLKERSKVRTDAINELEKMDDSKEDLEKKVKLLKQSVVITKKQIEECKEILHLMGIPVISGKEEADGQCAFLSKRNLVDAVASKDMDLLTYGVETLLLVNNTTTTAISLPKILSETNMSYEQFIDLCIMLGCDYCPTIEGIGMTKAYQLIKKYGSLNDIVNNSLNIYINRKKLIINDDFKNRYMIVQEYFKNPPVNLSVDESLKLKKPDFEQLNKLLIEKYSYSQNTIDKILINKLIGGNYKNINQDYCDYLFDKNNYNNNDDQFLDSDEVAVNELLNLTNNNSNNILTI